MRRAFAHFVMCLTIYLDLSKACWR